MHSLHKGANTFALIAERETRADKSVAPLPFVLSGVWCTAPEDALTTGTFSLLQVRPLIGFGLNASEARTSGKYGISVNRVRNYWQLDRNHTHCSRDRPSLS